MRQRYQTTALDASALLIPLLGFLRPATYEVVPSGSFTDPEYGRVGLTETETVQTVAACMVAGMTVEQIAEIQLAFPTFTEAVSTAAQKVCRTLGIGRFPQAWSYLGSDD